MKHIRVPHCDIAFAVSGVQIPALSSLYTPPRYNLIINNLQNQNPPSHDEGGSLVVPIRYGVLCYDSTIN